jgi:hypothetical protein
LNIITYLKNKYRVSTIISKQKKEAGGASFFFLLYALNFKAFGWVWGFVLRDFKGLGLSLINEYIISKTDKKINSIQLFFAL